MANWDANRLDGRATARRMSCHQRIDRGRPAYCYRIGLTSPDVSRRDGKVSPTVMNCRGVIRQVAKVNDYLMGHRDPKSRDANQASHRGARVNGH